jgi:hypothetical protein
MRWAGHVARMGEKRIAYRLLVGKPEGKRPLERPRRRWVDNIRMDLGEVGWSDVDWTGLAQNRNRRRALVNSVLNLRVPKNAGKLSSGLTSSGLCAAERDRHSSRQCVLYCSRTETDRQYTDCAAERDRHSSRQCVLHCSRTETDSTLCSREGQAQ